uniref:hypothetical protein n=1 Tax=Prevotella heparinolytica TaxID=28113 RepID=UPI0035A13543
MKKMFKILFWLVPALLVGCGSSDEPDIPLPKEKVIESTEIGSVKLVMLGYLDNVTAGGMLQPESFA